MAEPADRAANGASALEAGVAAALAGLLGRPLAPGLYTIATPIGNLGDITLRALATLARADIVYCEDTRHSLRLLQHYRLQRPTAPYHEHNAEAERPRILARLAAGQAVALISDAGTPLISDPGFKLVRAARAAGAAVWSLPGPSAVTAALASAGLATDCFTFVGFLPAKSGARRARLAELGDLGHLTGTLVLFEAPQRLAEALADMAAVLGDRPGAVARELTKLHEEVRLGRLGELADWARTQAPRGEMVVLVGAGERRDVADDEIIVAVQAALATLSLRDAAREIAHRLGVPRARVYALGLRLR